MYLHDKIIIGVPVFNEARFLNETLECLAAQNYKDFLVLIADNGSDDGSSEICRTFVKKDKRFIYFRHEHNIGASGNGTFIYEKTNSPYLMWFSGHDLIATEYLETQLKLLDKDPGIALAYSRITWIDETGNVTRETDGGSFVHDEESGLQRYLKTARGPWGECTAVNGIFRRSALTGMKFFPFAGPDHYILTKAQFFGRFYRTEKPIYLRREFKTRSIDYMECITGKKTSSVKKNDRPNMYPLAYAQIKDYLSLDIGAVEKLIHFPTLLLNLDRAYGLLYDRTRKRVRNAFYFITPTWLWNYARALLSRH